MGVDSLHMNLWDNGVWECFAGLTPDHPLHEQGAENVFLLSGSSAVSELRRMANRLIRMFNEHDPCSDPALALANLTKDVAGHWLTQLVAESRLAQLSWATLGMGMRFWDDEDLRSNLAHRVFGVALLPTNDPEVPELPASVKLRVAIGKYLFAPGRTGFKRTAARFAAAAAVA